MTYAETSIYSLLSHWGLDGTPQTDEILVADYLGWLGVSTVADYASVPCETEALYIARNDSALDAVLSFRAFVLGAHVTFLPQRGVLSAERHKLLCLLRAVERQRRRELVALLQWRWHELHEMDKVMRMIWEGR